jgi:hypothetical protein
MSTGRTHTGAGEATESSARQSRSGLRSATKRRREDHWWRYNRSIRFYGIVFLAGTKAADIVTTAVGIRLVPSIIEANPFAGGLFADLGLFTGLTLLGFASVLFAAGTAELFCIEIRRRLELSKTALFAQLSIYLTLSVLFGLVAIHNAVLVGDQVLNLLGDMLTAPGLVG